MSDEQNKTNDDSKKEDINLKNLNHEISNVIGSFNLFLDEYRSKQLTPTAKNHLTLVKNFLDHLFEHTIPEYLGESKAEKANALRNANLKIEELKKELGSKIDPQKCIYFIRDFASKFDSFLKENGINGHVKATVESFSIVFKVEYIEISTRLGSIHNYTQEEFDENVKEMNKIKENGEKHFDLITDSKGNSHILMNKKAYEALENIMQNFSDFLTLSNVHAKMVDNKLIIDSFSTSFMPERLTFNRDFY